MTLKQPQSMNELVYFTRRAVGKGHINAWVFREMCPACKKGLMGKPVGSNGRAKVRATEYVCPACDHTMEKQVYEETLTCNVEYTCPKCSFKGEAQIPFKRKKFQGVDSVVFLCEKCKEKIPITKKMKAIGSKADVPE